MNESLSVLVIITAAFKFINTRWMGLPSMIGVLLLSTAATLCLMMVSAFDPSIVPSMTAALSSLNLSRLLFGFMLSFILFAGAMQIDHDAMKQSRGTVMLLSTVSTILSTLVIGLVIYAVLHWLGMDLNIIACFMLGAILSPTDPVAVLAILYKAKLPQHVRVTVAGESLFNDGVGVVLFTLFLGLLNGQSEPSVGSIGMVLLHEVALGLVVGAAVGAVGLWLMRAIDHYATEVLISIAVVVGGDLLCHILNTSAPLAMVAAGLVVGAGSARVMSERTQDYVDKLWELIDEILNVALAVLIGMHLMLVHFQWTYAILSIVLLVMVPITRYFSIRLPFAFMPKSLRMDKGLPLLLTWCGLRGGISIAMALSLQADGLRDIGVFVTYSVVLFSVVVQGLTVERVADRLEVQ